MCLQTHPMFLTRATDPFNSVNERQYEQSRYLSPSICGILVKIGQYEQFRSFSPSICGILVKIGQYAQ
jgi:hypothetical protein